MAKVCLVGSAPASVRLAPYSDPSWRIIGCSPGVYGVATRVDEWFETHLWEPGQPWFSPEYVQWLQALPKRGVILWVGAPVGGSGIDPYRQPPAPAAPCVEGAHVYPFEAMLAKHDPKRWFCTSSLFWMMARAIEIIETEATAQQRAISPNLDKIALYGVDMAADSEYEMQRAGIHFMAYRAAAMGIEVGVPPESDLFTPRFRYGADEWTHSFRKIRARRQELEQRLAQAEAQMQAARDGVHFLKGAVEDLQYCGDTWADKGMHVGIVPGEEPRPVAPVPVVDVDQWMRTPRDMSQMQAERDAVAVVADQQDSAP